MSACLTLLHASVNISPFVFLALDHVFSDNDDDESAAFSFPSRQPVAESTNQINGHTHHSDTQTALDRASDISSESQVCLHVCVGCMDARMHGCMDAWMHGCTDACTIHGMIDWMDRWICRGWIQGA